MRMSGEAQRRWVWVRGLGMLGGGGLRKGGVGWSGLGRGREGKYCV